MDGCTAQFLVDSTWNTRIEQYQIDLVCLAILNSSFKDNTIDEVQELYSEIKSRNMLAQLEASGAFANG